MIDHVIGQRNFGKPTMIKAANKLVVKVYDAWLLVEVPNGMFFVKTEKKISQEHALIRMIEDAKSKQVS